MESSIPFLPGLQLSERFYHDTVAPILNRRFSGLRHGAARLGHGSEVLGFDTTRSRDHAWGPQVALFLDEADYSDALAANIRRIMGDELPLEVAGHPTHFVTPEISGGKIALSTERPIHHKVRITTVRRFFRWYMRLDPLGPGGLSNVEWLVTPEQSLRTVTTGGVFRDDLGELERARAVLHWFPHDLWLYLLAAQWRRIGQEEAFMARCAELGDELGSRIEAARLAREVMRLCFLMERQYAPYSKWFGTAFSRLECAPRVEPSLTSALAAGTWSERERHLSRAHEAVAEMHNSLGVTEPLPTRVSPVFDRPYLIIHADRFSDALEARIADWGVKRLPRHAGSTSQWADSTDVQTYPQWFGPLRAAYEEVGRRESQWSGVPPAEFEVSIVV